MKPMLSSKTLRLLFLSSLLSLWTYAQYPPAQGPLNVSENGNGRIREIPTSIITGVLNNIVRNEILPQLNESSGPVDVTYELKAGNPYMTSTKFTNRPNRSRIKIHYDLYFKLDIPAYPDRNIYQSLDIYIDCADWHTGNGRVSLTVEGQKPVLSDPSATEQVLDAILLFKLIPAVNNFVESYLPEKFRQSLALPALNPECNCLGVVRASRTNSDSWIRWQYNRPTGSFAAAETPFNFITIRVDSIRRLAARNYTTGGILYDEVEDIGLQFYANQTPHFFELQGMREGEARALGEHIIKIERPASSGSVVLIANLTINNGNNDTRFVVFQRRQNFGNGTRKIIVKKTFFTKPVRLPNGRMSKPQKVLRDAYVLSVRIVSQDAIVQ